MDFLTIGEIVRPQGILGEVKVKPLTDDANRFSKLKSVYIDGVPKRLLSVRLAGGFVYVMLGGVSDRNAAEALRGKMVEIDKLLSKELGEYEYFIEDLMGSEVYAGREKLGRISDILQNGAADVFVVEGPRPLMFPFLKKVVAEVDVKAKRVSLDGAELAKVAVYGDEDKEK